MVAIHPSAKSIALLRFSLNLIFSWEIKYLVNKTIKGKIIIILYYAIGSVILILHYIIKT